MNELEEVLAMEVRRYEHLYNPTLKEHKDQQMAWNSWQEIGQTLQRPAELCKNSWQKLRDRFSKAKARLKKKKKWGCRWEEPGPPALFAIAVARAPH